MKKWSFPSVIWILLACRLLEGFLQAWFPYPVPHIWRQTDTLGVGIRYAQRWLEGVTGWEFWLPAVLNTGASTGIMPMEFPLYNFLLGAGYLINWNHGALYASLLAYGWALLLWGSIMWAWRRHHIMGAPAWHIWLLLPLLGQCGIYWCKLMPDFTAMAFALLACAFVWDKNTRYRPWLACVLATIGLLIKPPVFIVFALLLLKKKKWDLVQQAPWLCISIAITILYYTKGLDLIRLHTHRSELFATQLQTPWLQWSSVWQDWRSLLAFLADGVLFPGGLICLLLLYMQPHPAYKSLQKIGGLLVLQLLAILSLDGAHGFVHRYYFIGMSPLLCSAIYLTFYPHLSIWSPTRWQRILTLLFVGLWIGAQVDRSATELYPLWCPNIELHKRPLWNECAHLREQHPEVPWQQAQVFRSDAEVFPLLGVCFGEKQGAITGKWGFYWRDTEIPASCKEIDGTPAFKLVQCYD